MSTNTQTPSVFAKALASLLDDTKLYDRQGWANHLKVSENAINDWVSDKGLPVASALADIVDAVKSSAGVSLGPFFNFERIAEQPADEVSPLGEFMLPTVEEYLKNYTIQDVRRLRQLTRQDKDQILAGTWYPEAIKRFLED